MKHPLGWGKDGARCLLGSLVGWLAGWLFGLVWFGLV